MAAGLWVSLRSRAGQRTLASSCSLLPAIDRADYLIRTEHLEEDSAQLLELMNARRRPDAAPLDVPSLLAALHNPNAKRCSGEKAGAALVAPEQYCDETLYFAGEHAPCFEALARYYADDARAAGLYSPCEAVSSVQ